MTTGNYNLDLKQPKRNVFVTQLQEGDYEEDDQNNHAFPVVRETAGKLLETGIRTLQRTLLLKKEVEVDKVDEELREKREEFKRRMEACIQKQVDVQKRQQKMKDRVLKFEKFIKDNESKRKRAIQKYHMEVKLKEQKGREYDNLCKQLAELRARQVYLDKKIHNHRKFYEYLLKVIDMLPENYIEATDDVVTGMTMRHQTLSGNNKLLVDNLESMVDEIESLRTTLDEMKQNHDKTKLSINSKLSTMQKEQEEMVEINQHSEETRVNKKAEYRNQCELLGTILMSIGNISDKCMKKEQADMQDWTLEKRLELIQEYMNEREDVYRMSSGGVSVTPSQTERRSRSERSSQGKKAPFR